MKWEITKDGCMVPIPSEEEKRNHVPHWCSDVIRDEEFEKIKSVDVPEDEMPPEMKRRREEAIQMLKEEILKSSHR